MSGALAERPLPFFEDARRRGQVAAPWHGESFDGGGLTLELRLESVWEGLAATDEAECPLCRGRMTRPAGAAAATAGSAPAEPARCGDCGSTLA